MAEKTSQSKIPLTAHEFAILFIDKFGKGKIDPDSDRVQITDLGGDSYVYVIDNPESFCVGLRGLRGCQTCEKNDEGVETAYRYISHLESQGWLKPRPKVALEALGPDFKKRRIQIQKMIYETMDLMDPSGDNTRRWQKILEPMSDKQFDEFIENLRNKKCQMNIVMPNMKKTLRIPDLLKAAKKVGLKTSHRLWLPDRTRPGKRYLTNEKYLVLELPIRRAQQEWDKKLQVPSRDTHVDALTGQVIMDDKACHLSMPEIQSLSTRGLENVLNEFVKVRGGDVMAYGDFKRQLEEAGEAKLSSLDPRTRARSGVISHVLLQSMMIDNNL